MTRRLKLGHFTGANSTELVSLEDIQRTFLRDSRLLILLLDDQPRPQVYADKLGIANDSHLFFTDDLDASYRVLFSSPFPFDGVIIDWRLDGWKPLDAESAARIGIPDTVPEGGLFTSAFQAPRGTDEQPSADASQGGHAEFLCTLAAAQHALVITSSIHIPSEDMRVVRLKARGSHYFLPKSDLQSKREEVRALLFSIAGTRRDLRLWRSATPDELDIVLQQLQAISSTDLWRMFKQFEATDPKRRHELALAASDRDARVAYLMRSLAFLNGPRLFCASRLLDQALSWAASQDNRAEDMFRRAETLQPSLRPEGAGDCTARTYFRGVVSEIAVAHRTHGLPADEDYLHIFVSPGLGRIDYYASKRARAARVSVSSLGVQYLGTAFSPRLAVAVGENGVWPASKLSKLRHLVRAPRLRRLIHQGKAVARCADGVFGPTIDSLLLGDLLLRLITDRRSPLSAATGFAEVGTGTGLLLCLVAGHRRDRCKLLFGSDVSPEAVECTGRNLHVAWPIGFDEGKVHIVLSAGALSLVGEQTLDLIVTNPPYLPRPHDAGHGTHEHHGNQAISGDAVIRDVLLNSGPVALRHDGVVLMVTSTLTEEIVNQVLEDAEAGGIKWHQLRLKELPWVPLDLPEVQEDPDWVKWLVGRNAKHVLVDPTSSAYPLRHGIVATAFARTVAMREKLRSFFESDNEK